MITATNLKFTKYIPKRITTNKIVLHHAAAVRCDAETIHKWHLANGWAGIGYHFVVRKDGTIQQGREIDSVGAHCTGQNGDSIGICFEGDFTKEKMSQTQINAGKELVKYLRNLYGKGIRFCKHSDLYNTSCPGKNFPFDEITKQEETKKKNKYSGKLPTFSKGQCLDVGSKGENVRLIQLFLNWYGNYGLVIDSDYGFKTFSAVKSFQSKEKLVVDGIFGEKSLAKAKKVKK